VPDAFEDFSVITTESGIHLVCQNLQGSILYVRYDGDAWKTEHLLESREKHAVFKNITLKKIGNFIHLFYVVFSKENHILIHQLLGKPGGQPKVVDYIHDAEFSVCNHQTSDMTVLYRNSEKVYGTKKYRWSKKEFDAFVPLDCGCNLEHAVIMADKDENLSIAAYAKFDKFLNILYLTKNQISNDYAIAAIHLVSGTSEGLAFANCGDTLSLNWCENGLVMTSVCTNNKWSTPKKYIRGTTQENILYHLQSEAENFSSYGYRQDGKILLYITRDILEHPPKKESTKTPTATIKDSALKENIHTEYVKRSVYSADMAAIRKLLSGQNELIVELLKKISALEQEIKKPDSIAEDENQIDRLAAENIKKA